jgi:hypothetical protein
MSEDEFT